MLTQKKDDKAPLSTVHKTSAKIIKLNKQGKEEEETPKKETGHKTPPLDDFNTSYIKGKDNDLL